MVKERVPPKATLGSEKPYEQTRPDKESMETSAVPRFGNPTMPQSNLNRTALESKVLIMPKPARQESQKDQPKTSSVNPSVEKPAPQIQFQHRPPVDAPIPLPWPSDGIKHKSIQPISQPTFGYMHSGGFRSVNQGAGPSNFIDLTNDLSTARLAALQPSYPSYSFVDPSKAAEDIKALLEGAIEDEDDVPRTRLRKRKNVRTEEGLAAKLRELSVTGDETSTSVDQDSDDDEDDGTVEGISVKLLPHQVDGLAWMRERELGTGKKGTVPKGGILADDMGLGKTLQSISLILTNPKPTDCDLEDGKRKFPKDMVKSTLVVAPLALIRQWELELKEKVSDSHRLRVCVHHGPNRTKRYEDLKKYDVVITTYQILVSEYAGCSGESRGIWVGCFGLHWYRVILDEAHTIKNRNAKATQACYGLRSGYRWCLSGTPMQNNLDELQSLIKFLRIKPYDDLATWRDQIDRPMKNGRGDLSMKRLQHYLKTFMKRRTKEILKQDGALNPGGKPSVAAVGSTGFKVTERKIENITAEFSEKERHFYSRLEKRADRSLEEMMDADKVNYASALVLLLRLRQACNHPKLVANKLGKDCEALGTENRNSSQNSRKPKVSDDDIDEMADLFGGLGMDAKKCDICGLTLSQELSKSGAIRCDECEEDLVLVKESTKDKARKKSHVNKEKGNQGQVGRKPRNRQVILDSDDEDDGEWIGAGEDPGPIKLGKAGGTDDENADGEGESIGSTDTDSEAEGDSDDSSDGDVKYLGSKIKDKKRAKTHDSIEGGDSDVGDDSESDVEDDFQSSSEDEAELATVISSTKINQLLKILRKEAKEHKFIVFSQFTSMLDLVEPFLKRDGYRYTRYDGSMKNDQREASLSSLRNDKSCRALLCSLKCGSLGLNLTAATRVVILEPFWNPFVEEQAIDRVHRLTQTIDVVVYKITIQDTVEERIVELQEKKRELANQAIEGGTKSKAGKLTMKEILQLFRRDSESTLPDPSHYSTGIKPKMLSTNSTASSSREGPVKITGEAKAAPPKENDIYGRRW